MRHDVNLSQYQVEGCGPGAIAAAGIAAAGHGLRAGTLPGRAAHIGRPSACPLRHRCSRFPVTPSSCPASKGRAVVARRSPTRTMGGPRSLRRVGSLRAFVLSSSNVPSWVVARPLVVGSMQIAFRRRFKTPRPFGPPPASGGLAPPMERRRCRCGNLLHTTTRPQYRTMTHPSLRPSLRGKGTRGHGSAAAGNRCGGERTAGRAVPVRGRSLYPHAIAASRAAKISLGNFFFTPLTRRRPADSAAMPNGKHKTERKDPS